MQFSFNLEPVYGILLAALVFGETERMSGRFYVGTAITIAVVMGLPWIRRTTESPASLSALGK